ncbi:polyprenyl synthetase family protein [Desulfoscipio gibsoniae]|uniref:Geranylgeranyl pyrophosphate synthase n=1 Tax=Desulfoscipio gibsoniae DSM 7213 TaxID=767817 RepID=R4KEF3_9FIRM|nr:polyprenyl synthetase family protein [Desulfoscipio gibsoniae]AGL01553.1 geranylgeranyl pyrophosphate synthase [Desulfoscipio gibsoniae DSM 7213]
MHIFQHISDDLEQVHKLINKNFLIRTSNIRDYVKQDFNYLYINLRPALVLICHRLFCPPNRQAVALAAVLQFIFMASQVHIKLSEDDTGHEKPVDIRTGYQFPVLVGDYLYGKFFTTLCDAGIVHYLKNMAELICTINKNGVKILKNPDLAITDPLAYNEVIRGESAELMACGTYLGADLAGADKAIKDKLYQFGLNLGMAFGLLSRGASTKQINDYVAKAELILKQLPSGKDKESLRDLLGLFATENTATERMVV